MNTKAYSKLLIAMILCMIGGGGAWAQYSVNLSRGSTEIDCCKHPSGMIYDDGGPNGAYSNNFDGRVTLTAPEGMRIRLWGEYQVVDSLWIWEGDDWDGRMKFYLVDQLDIVSQSRSLTIRLRTDQHSEWGGFALAYQCVGVDSTVCQSSVNDIEFSFMNDSTVWLHWSGTSSWYWLAANGDTVRQRTTSYMLTGLTPGETYDLAVSGLLDSLAPCCSAIRQFRATCGRIEREDLPYSYGFEDATGNGSEEWINPCWTGTRGAFAELHPTTTTPHAGTYAVVLNSRDTMGGAVLAMPYYTHAVNETMLDFWVKNGGPGGLEVGVMSNPCDMSTFERVATVGNSSETYEHHIVSFESYHGMGHYVAFRTSPGVLQQILLDDVRLSLRLACPQILNLQVVNQNTTSMVLNWWTMDLNNRIASYEITATPSSGDTIITRTATECPFILDGLAPDKEYTVAIRCICRSGTVGPWETMAAHTEPPCAGLSSSMGSGCTSNPNVPVTSSRGNTICQSIYTVEQLYDMGVRPGLISKMQYTWTPNHHYVKRLRIYLTTTEQENYNNSSEGNTLSYPPVTEGQTLVYGGTHTLLTSGEQTYFFTNPYYWDGNSNLVVTTIMNQPPDTSHSFSNFYGYATQTQTWPTICAARNNEAFEIGDLATTQMFRSRYQPCVRFYSCASDMECQTPLVTVNRVGTTEATIEWSQGAGVRGWAIAYRQAEDTTWHTVETNFLGNQYHLTGLTTATKYYIRVTALCDNDEAYAQVSAITLCKESRLIYDDLYASNVTCYTGSFNNPRASIGALDHGPEAESSRHTVHRDVSERDPLTGNQLRTVPEGYCSSVRLGNWTGGAKAESISYTLQIDTTDYDLLLLKYAVVLENPDHSEQQQPRFTFSITDLDDSLISPCYSADFIANITLGWNYTAMGRLWKDWTALGIDLTPLQGQTIKVNLTTYDCSAGGHFGYAYFVLDLDNKRIKSSSCNTVENTFHAPAGFAYRWYSAMSAATLSTADSVHVVQPGVYYCDLSYVGAPNDAAHANCHFTLTAVAGERHPYARFNMENMDSNSCLHVSMKMTNRSIITSDSAHLDSIANGCESYLWDFGDGSTSTERNPVHVYLPGTYRVKLYAMLANGDCADTAIQEFTYVNRCVRYDTVAYSLCEGDTLWMFDTILTSAGVYHLDSIIAGDSVLSRTLYLSVRHRSQTLTAMTVCDSFYWSQTSLTYTVTGLYTDTLTNHVGCDSLVKLDLTVDTSYDIHYYDTIYIGDTLLFEGTVCDTPGVYVHPGQTQLGCDSVRTLHLEWKLLVADSLWVSICEGEGFEFHDTVLRTSGIYNRLVRSESLSVPDTLWKVTLTVIPLPQIAIDSQYTCKGDAHYRLEAHASLPYCHWWSCPSDPALTRQAGDSVITVNPDETTTYYVLTEYAQEPKCTVRDSIELKPLKSLTAWIEANPTRLVGEQRTVTARGQTHGHADRYEWYLWYDPTPPTLYDTLPEIWVEVPETADSLRIQLLASNELCHDTDWVTIPITKSEIFFPNIFTPNRKDNNSFHAYYTNITDFEIWIYDRRGDLVFHSTDINEGWDGTHEGRPCVQAAYVYTCTYKDTITPGGVMKKTGTVVLVR